MRAGSVHCLRRTRDATCWFGRLSVEATAGTVCPLPHTSGCPGTSVRCSTDRRRCKRGAPVARPDPRRLAAANDAQAALAISAGDHRLVAIDDHRQFGLVELESSSAAGVAPSSASSSEPLLTAAPSWKWIEAVRPGASGRRTIDSFERSGPTAVASRVSSAARTRADSTRSGCPPPGGPAGASGARSAGSRSRWRRHQRSRRLSAKNLANHGAFQV